MCSVGNRVMIVLLLLTAAGGWREPANQHDHVQCSCCWEELWAAGEQSEMLRVHDSAERRAFLSSVEVFKVNTGC